MDDNESQWIREQPQFDEELTPASVSHAQRWSELRRRIRINADAPEHLNGVKWFDAPLPRWWHRCAAQTRAWSGMTRVERCACGAARIDGGSWINKNETRNARSVSRG